MTVNTVCLSGGGVKGFAFLGALEYLEDIKYIDIKKIDNYVGTSAGAMLSFIFSLGYSVMDVVDFIINFNFTKLIPDTDINTVLLSYGIDTGDKIMIIMQNFLKEKYNLDDITFRENKNWAEIDQLSIPQYLDRIGIKGWLKSFYMNQMSGYYTMDAQYQSAVNLFLLLQLPDDAQPETEDQSEVFKIKGGSQALTHAMNKSLEDQIKMGYSLIEIHKNKENSFTAVFEYLGTKKMVKADYLILAIPFTKLREVKTIGFNWSTTKNECIQHL